MRVFSFSNIKFNESLLIQIDTSPRDHVLKWIKFLEIFDARKPSDFNLLRISPESLIYQNTFYHPSHGF